MWKRFIRKYKEDILLCLGALTAGIVSFIVTLNVYPKIKDENINEDVLAIQTNLISNVSNQEVQGNANDVEPTQEMQEDIDKTELNEISGEDVIVIPVFENMEETTISEENTKAFEENEIIPTIAYKNEFEFCCPISGDIIKAFANDSLVYSKTLNEWIIHEGIDIAGIVGDSIVASEDGIVEQIFEDSKYGKTIVISHENGYKTVYSFANASNMISVQENVKKEQVIAKLTESSGFEAEDKPHLHFEILKDGVNISPLNEIK